MALARCDKCGHPKVGTVTYAHRHDLISHPYSGLVCGRCEGEVSVWLTDQEEKSYLAGKRVFEFATQTAKVRVT